MYFTNITGGEPFIRTDLKDIVRELYKKSDRIVISTNGFFTDRIVDLCKEFPQIGIRISIEGLSFFVFNDKKLNKSNYLLILLYFLATLARTLNGLRSKICSRNWNKERSTAF